MIAHAFPLSQTGVPAEVTLLPATANEGSYNTEGADVSIELPLSISQLPQGTFVDLNGMIVTLTNANGFLWDSGWQGQGHSFFPDQKSAEIGFRINRNILDKLKTSPVSIHLLLAFTTYHVKNQREFVVPEGEFQLPEIGLCSSERGY